ncbi:chromosomal replication initiator protein DnaA, partial [Butyricicoccus sp.]|uniref:chromosomal replication initiator protein DnaA n=1 Tax=Butyricicoccus sp. TaxID=2049021 RepID=UPI003D7C86FE
FIYGQSGLGKTHLLYAIANVVRRDHPSFRIIYIKGEDFTNELVNSIGAGQVQEFRDKYRLADLLLVDDIQFVAGKDRTQEEFFHTFNALYEANKQIVLTSDRPPKEIHTLEDRLKTRFEWGLLADIQPPDYETRMAIIHVKADSLRVQLPEDVVDYIAKTITSNVRQLEGTVKKIKALHDLMERAIDIELAKEAVADIFKENPGLNPTPDMILREVSRYYCTPVEKLKGSGRSKDLVLPRQVAMYLVRDLTDYSLPEIGKIFSRDHTTVLHSINKIENYLKETSEMDNIIKTLKTNIRG